MLDANLKTQLKAYLEKVSQPFEIVASLDDSDKSRELLGLLQENSARGWSTASKRRWTAGSASTADSSA